jgi:DNA-binding transcriptional regulator YhcF (GntR family)
MSLSYTILRRCPVNGKLARAVPKRVDGVVKNGVNARTDRPTGGQHVTRELMHGQILPQIRRDIITGRWPPGARLSEPALCGEFGVSRTPLRDALRVLQAEGLIQLVPHVGAIVTQATGRGIGDKMELLIAIEQLAAFKVARQGSAATIRTITEPSSSAPRTHRWPKHTKGSCGMCTGRDISRICTSRFRAMWASTTRAHPSSAIQGRGPKAK